MFKVRSIFEVDFLNNVFLFKQVYLKKVKKYKWGIIEV